MAVDKAVDKTVSVAEASRQEALNLGNEELVHGSHRDVRGQGADVVDGVDVTGADLAPVLLDALAGGRAERTDDDLEAVGLVRLKGERRDNEVRRLAADPGATVQFRTGGLHPVEAEDRVQDRRLVEHHRQPDLVRVVDFSQDLRPALRHRLGVQRRRTRRERENNTACIPLETSGPGWDVGLNLDCIGIWDTGNKRQKPHHLPFRG